MAHPTFGLIAAPFTPLHPDRSLNLDAIPHYAQWLQRQGVRGAFVCGTTGEGSSLTSDERRQVAERWVQSAPPELRIIVHVGHAALAECCELARHAQRIGAGGTACLAPYFFRPSGESGLVDWCQQVAAAAPELPFYYYHIPVMTGFQASVSRFLELAAPRIPNLAGAKYTFEDLEDLQRCVQAESGRFDILFGRDEMLLAAVRQGVRGAVGSTYNFAAPLYQAMLAAQGEGDVDRADHLQSLAARMISVMESCGGSPLAAFKRLMSRLVLDCGPTRQPLVEPSEQQFAAAWQQLQHYKLDQWLQPQGNTSAAAAKQVCD